MIGKVRVKRDLCMDRWWVVECSICGSEEEYSMGGTKTNFAKSLNEHGWRQAISKPFQVIGLVCSNCIADPEYECVPCEYVNGEVRTKEVPLCP